MAASMWDNEYLRIRSELLEEWRVEGSFDRPSAAAILQDRPGFTPVHRARLQEVFAAH